MSFIYVIEFDQATIKIGTTRNTENRFQAHLRSARAFGREITRTWVSEAHGEPYKAEAALVSAMVAAGGTQKGREFFDGVSFKDAVHLAEALPVAPVKPVNPHALDGLKRALFPTTSHSRCVVLNEAWSDFVVTTGESGGEFRVVLLADDGGAVAFLDEMAARALTDSILGALAAVRP